MQTFPEQFFEINSDQNSIDSNIADLKVNFEPELVLSDKKHYIRLIDSQIPITIDNISDSFLYGKNANNTLRYSLDNGSSWDTITIPNGRYDGIENIDNAIREGLIDNGDTVEDPITEEYTFPFGLTANVSSSKSVIYINDDTSLYPNYAQVIIELDNDGKSELYEVLGFDDTQLELKGSVATKFTSNDNIDIVDSYFKIYMDCVMSNIAGENEHILITGALTGPANTYYFLPNRDIKDVMAFIAPSHERRIQEVRLRLLDRNDNLLQFSDTSIDNFTRFKFYIY